MRTKQEIAIDAGELADVLKPQGPLIGQVSRQLALMIHDLAIALCEGPTAERDAIKAPAAHATQGLTVSAAYPSQCAMCRDTGVLTGNNDWPCSCSAGDHALFNTPHGSLTGAQIKAGR